GAVLGAVGAAFGEFVGDDGREVLLVLIGCSGSWTAPVEQVLPAAGSQHANEVAVPGRPLVNLLGLSPSGAKQVEQDHLLQFVPNLQGGRNTLQDGIHVTIPVN